jgi:hypothetical protein
MPALTGFEDRGAHQERVRLLGVLTWDRIRKQENQSAACHRRTRVPSRPAANHARPAPNAVAP